MDKKNSHRKLNVILSADSFGYSHQMQDDDPATINTLEGNKLEILQLLKLFRSIVVNSPRENLLAELASILVMRNEPALKQTLQ